MFKILQAKLQQYMIRELPHVQAGFRKCRGTRDQIANNCWSLKKQESSRKTSTSALLTTPMPFDCVNHSKLWKILKEMGIPDYQTCLLRNTYAGQEATVRTGHGTMDWLQIDKEVCKVCILSLCLFTLYAECIMWNAGLDEAQVGIKIARKNINSLR